MKNFTAADVDRTGEYPRLRTSADRTELVYAPPKWMEQGLQETSSGYGKRLNSGYKISYEGKLYRVYTTIFSNNGTCWFKCKGEKIIVA
jgi:hypothetical protein